jgi:hypothetical protein
MSIKDMNSPETLAWLQHEWEHAVAKAKQAAADAISHEPLWEELRAHRETLETFLDDYSLDLLMTFAIETGLLAEAVNEWGYGAPEEML